MPFLFEKLNIPEVILIKPKTFKDNRGFFMEVYKKSEFNLNGIPDSFVQENYSYSSRGVLRGLHYQKSPKAQGKLVNVVRGEIFDVAVDIRQGSPTYGCWAGEILSAKNNRMLYIPIGFAHGFCVTSESAEVVYKINGSEYSPEHEAGINWNDPAIGIEWPTKTPNLVERDFNLPLLDHSDNNFKYIGEYK